MVGHAGSPTGIVHADMTLIRSKFKVKVTGLLNFQKLPKPCVLAAMTVSPLARLSGYVFAFLIHCVKLVLFSALKPSLTVGQCHTQEECILLQS